MDNNLIRSRKRDLNNKPVPDAKRARMTKTVKTVRISNLPNNVRHIDKEGTSVPVVRASTTRRAINRVAIRSNSEQQRALNVSSLVGHASSKNTLDEMIRSVYQLGTEKGLSINVMDQAVGQLYRTYSQYNRNLVNNNL